MQGESVNVSVRIRPLLSHEDGEKEVFERHVLADGREVIRAKEAESGILFNKVYTKQQTNEDVFGGIGKRMVSRLLEGFNGTVFMYGQTGSGKTHTMTGSENDAGLTPRIIDHLFEEIRSSTERQFLVRGSYLEIYNEQVFDLCCDRAKRELKFNTKTDAFFVDGLKEQIAKQAADLNAVRAQGEAAKKMGVSNLNEHSSRSHSVFSIIVESTENAAANTESGDEASSGGGADDGASSVSDTDTQSKEAEAGIEQQKRKQKQPPPPKGEPPNGGRPAAPKNAKVVRLSTLNLVDLAGSETFTHKFGRSQQKETVAINKSLSALKDVIIALSKKASFTPFRNSELTKLLKSSLGGNACCDIICCVTPAEAHAKTTSFTLEFGKMASKVTNIPRQNIASSNDRVLIRKYQRQISQMAAKLRAVERLEKEKMAMQEEVRRLRALSSCIVNAEENDSKLRDLQRRASRLEEENSALHDDLQGERKARLAALDTATERDHHVALTIQETDNKLVEMRQEMELQFERQREMLLSELENERAALKMQRTELRAVVAQRRELEEMRQQIEELSVRNASLESQLLEARQVIQALTASASPSKDA